MDPRTRSVKWYYGDGTTKRGPLENDVLEELIRRRSIGPDILVWRKGQETWIRAADSELKHVFDQPPSLPEFGFGPGPGSSLPCIAIALTVIAIGVLWLNWPMIRVVGRGILNFGARKQLAGCRAGLELVQTAMEEYIARFEEIPAHTGVIVDAGLLQAEAVQGACGNANLAAAAIVAQGDDYTLVAAPAGRFSDTCNLVLTREGVRIIPLKPNGCR